MSTFDSDDRGGSCYLLTEDGQLRLRQLGDHMTFLSQLAQPRTADEEADARPEVAMGELAVCLELLSEQVDQVLEGVSWSGRRKKNKTDAYAAADTVDERFSFGLTMDQVDALNRLSALLSAHGDVVSASETTEFVDHPLASLGQAIFESAQAVRDIMREVEADQSLRAKPSTTGVREERAVYGVAPVHVPLLLERVRPDYASRPH